MAPATLPTVANACCEAASAMVTVEAFALILFGERVIEAITSEQNEQYVQPNEADANNVRCTQAM